MDDLFTDLFAFHNLSLGNRLERALQAMVEIWNISFYGWDREHRDDVEDLDKIREIAEQILKENGWWKED